MTNGSRFMLLFATLALNFISATMFMLMVPISIIYGVYQWGPNSMDGSMAAWAGASLYIKIGALYVSFRIMIGGLNKLLDKDKGKVDEQQKE